jgi:hypothetical protein
MDMASEDQVVFVYGDQLVRPEQQKRQYHHLRLGHILKITTRWHQRIQMVDGLLGTEERQQKQTRGNKRKK